MTSEHEKEGKKKIRSTGKRRKDSRVEHGFVDAGVVALLALEWLGSQVIAQVVLQVMLELRHERTLRTVESLVLLDVVLGVFPEVLFVHRDEGTLLAPVFPWLALHLTRHRPGHRRPASQGQTVIPVTSRPSASSSQRVVGHVSRIGGQVAGRRVPLDGRRGQGVTRSCP